MDDARKNGSKPYALTTREETLFAALVASYHDGTPPAEIDPPSTAGPPKKKLEICGCAAILGAAFALSVCLAENGSATSPLLAIGIVALLTALTATGSFCLSAALGTTTHTEDRYHFWLPM